jgi:hypothetical protein
MPSSKELGVRVARTRLTPPAAALMQSFRGVGYDARTALADLIDNSISARASNIWLRFDWAGRESTVALLDDGHGMGAEELERAMTLGSRSPLDHRDASDLGRFGLGLKTASLSQCSRLVVASRRQGAPISVRVWDLETVLATDDWLVDDELTSDEEAMVQSLEERDSGTLVLWRRLDRLVGDVSSDDPKARLDFQRTAREVEAHLAMVFHRFLDGIRPRLRMFVNGTDDEFRVRPWDPFCTAHPATQQMPEVRRSSVAGAVVMQGFVLPHKDRFETDGHDLAAGPAGWTSQQGFYVYRNERLLVSGAWLGLGQPRRWMRDEQHKLARIRLDLPNTFDASWSIDIKKSTAKPPLELRDWLTRNAERVRFEAREVFVHRGNRIPAAARAEFSPAWLSESVGSPRYRVNREHPLVSALFDATGGQRAAVERALRLLETTIPVHRIWLDVAEKPEAPAATRQQLESEEVAKLAEDLLGRLITGQKLTRSGALHRLRHTEPFDQYPEILAALDK